jgi:hypothetical protein
MTTPRRHRRHQCTATIGWLTALLLPFTAVIAQEAESPEIFAAPAAIGVGAEVRVLASGLQTRHFYEIWLRPATVGLPAVQLQGSFEGSDGVPYDAVLGIPSDGSLLPGMHSLELRRPAATSPLQAAFDVELLAPLQITLEADNARAGSPVGVSVTGLRPGQLLLDYAGAPVLGPLPTAGGEFRGEFIVPLDRPTGFGTTTVTARNLVRGVESQRGSTGFTARPPLTGQRVELLSVSPLPAHPLRPGERFTVSGQLALRSGDPRRMQLEPVLRLPSGISVPLLRQPAALDADGGFSIEIANPNLAKNHGAFAASGQLKLLVRHPPQAITAPVGTDPFAGVPVLVDSAQTIGQGVAVGSVDLGQVHFLPSVNDLRIHVVLQRPAEAGENGPQPLANARVVVASRAELADPGSFSGGGKALAGGGGAADAMFGMTNQLQYLSSAVQAQSFLDWATGCPHELFRGYTDANGEFEIVLNRDTLELMTAFQFNAAIHSEPFAMPLDFEIAINALAEGHGECSGSHCAPSVITARYSFQLDEFQVLDAFGDYDGVGKDWLLQQTIPKLPAGANLGLVAEAALIGLPVAIEPKPGLGTLFFDRKYRPITSVATLSAAQVEVKKPLLMRFSHNANLYGQLGSAALWLNGQHFMPIDLAAALDGPKCVEGGDEVHYKFEIPNARLFPPGNYDLEVRYTLQGSAGIGGRSKRLRLPVEALPKWFGSAASMPANLAERRVTLWSPGEVRLFGREKAPPERGQDGDDFSSPEYDFDIPGNVENRTNLSGRVVSEIRTAGGDSALATEQTSINRGASRDAAPRKQAASLAASSVSFIGKDEFSTIIDTGRIPLFRMSWGFWPLAGALIGADAWFAALYKYYGVVELQQLANMEQQFYTNIDTSMQLQAGVALFMDVSILFNLIRVRGEAQGLIALGLETGLEVTDAAPPKIKKPDACLRLGILFLVRATAGWCPFCIEAFDQVKVLDKTFSPSPGPKPACAIPQLDLFAKALEKSAASFDDKQPATIEDANGQGMQVWVKDGVLRWRRTSGGSPYGATSPLFHLCSGLVCNSATGPALGVLKNNRYVLAWSETRSPISSGQGWDKAADYRIHYSLWNGSSWSTPQRLGSSTIGEGSVHLASCPNYRSGCPSQGEVSAVWSREVSFAPSAEFLLGQSDIWYSRLQSSGSPHAWTAPIKLNDSMLWQNNMGRVIYTNGSGRPPLVFWVNSPSALVKDTDQRRIYYRFPLQAGSAPQLSTGTSSGTGWMDASVGSGSQVHLAYTVGEHDVGGFMGNQQEIFTARASCAPSSGCSFEQRRVRDQFGRTVRGENVRVAAGSGGKTTVFLRGLGYGKNALGHDYFSSDPSGVVQSTGDIVKVTQGYGIDLGAHIAAMTTDGALYWNISMSQSASGDSLLSAVSQSQLTGKHRQLMAMAGHRNPPPLMKLASEGEDDDLVFGQVLAVPNFSLDAVMAVDTGLRAGDSFEVIAAVSNGGIDHVGPISVVASWDGPPGIGLPGTQVVLAGLAAGASAQVELSLTVPADVLPGARHTIHVVINPDAAVIEQTMIDNARSLDVGGLAPPENFRLGGGAGHPFVFLTWDAPDDPRVASVRVYRSDNDGPLLSIGSSPVEGYLDLTSAYDSPYSYYVSSFSQDGIESALVGPLQVILNVPYPVFRDSFEPDPDLLPAAGM